MKQQWTISTDQLIEWKQLLDSGDTETVKQQIDDILIQCVDRMEAKNIKEGMWCDLKGDKYADPDNDNLQLQTEYVLVDYVEQETPECIAIGFSGFDVIGFPPEHKIKMKS